MEDEEKKEDEVAPDEADIGEEEGEEVTPEETPSV